MITRMLRMAQFQLLAFKKGNPLLQGADVLLSTEWIPSGGDDIITGDGFCLAA